MNRKALIVRGGWDGHQPKQVAEIFARVLRDEKFDVEVSVVIPVRNRVKTVADAVKSALSQKPDFEFNVIVVDNHSTDGTTELLVGLSEADSRLVHIVPERADLGIGGCWNEAIYSPRCGRYAVQLDSDDIYSSDDVLSRVGALESTDVDALGDAHRAWWKAFYRKSFVEIPDKTLEKHFYASLYLLASSSRSGVGVNHRSRSTGSPSFPRTSDSSDSEKLPSSGSKPTARP